MSSFSFDVAGLISPFHKGSLLRFTAKLYLNHTDLAKSIYAISGFSERCIRSRTAAAGIFP